MRTGYKVGRLIPKLKCWISPWKQPFSSKKVNLNLAKNKTFGCVDLYWLFELKSARKSAHFFHCLATKGQHIQDDYISSHMDEIYPCPFGQESKSRFSQNWFQFSTKQELLNQGSHVASIVMVLFSSILESWKTWSSKLTHERRRMTRTSRYTVLELSSAE